MVPKGNTYTSTWPDGVWNDESKDSKRAVVYMRSLTVAQSAAECLISVDIGHWGSKYGNAMTLPCTRATSTFASPTTARETRPEKR
jgi:hypothetical protein